MATPLKLHVCDPVLGEKEFSVTGRVVLGRQQSPHEPPPFSLAEGTDPPRLVVAGLHEIQNYHRSHVELEPLEGRVRVTSLGQLPVQRSDGQTLAGGAAAEWEPPFALLLGSRRILVSLEETDEAGVGALQQRSLAPGSMFQTRAGTLPRLPVVEMNQLVEWLQTSVVVLQSALASNDFLDRAAQAMVDIVGLDAGAILLFDGSPPDPERWKVAAAAPALPEGWRPSAQLVNEVLDQQKTVWVRPGRGTADPSDSLTGVWLAIAAPLLDAAGRVRGLLYGERRAPTRAVAGEQKVEAVLVELLASSVAAGLVRQGWVLFGQFFGGPLAAELQRNDQLLAPHHAEVTCLFCDICGFSSLSERKPPEEMLSWLNEVLGRMSAIILGHGGVLVDYVGDEVFAMWGAPYPQEDQRDRAARAAIDIRDALPELNARWGDWLGGTMDVHIGINTGPASVGNVGSELKYKYGPLGNTVNLASRVEGLTKYLQRCGVLATGATAALLGPEFLTRRVVKVRVAGIQEPVDVYEVAQSTPGDEGQAEFFRKSEEALDCLEAGEPERALRLLAELLPNHVGDGPLLLLLNRAARLLSEQDHLRKQGKTFDPVWEPPGK